MPAGSYDGIALFGRSHRIQVLDNPTAAQIASFFGVNGQVSLHGGGRGRAFEVTGVLVGSDLGELAAKEDLLRSYEDGLGRVLVDTKGKQWPSVVFSRYMASGPWGYLAGGVGVAQPYKALLQGSL